MDEQKIYRAALAAWGADAQTLMVFEEMAELQKELCKAARGRDNREQIAEEIADFREMYREMAAKFADYKAAEVTGQLVVFPCRVTDTVYYIETVHKGRKYAGGRVVSAQIDHVTIGGTTGKPVFDLCTETENWLYALEPGEFFLTREEAEKALEEGRKNGEY